MRKTTILVAAFAVLTACGGNSETALGDAEAIAPPAISTTAVTAVVAATPELLPTEMTLDLRYHPGDEPFSTKSGAIDVVAPTEGGPFPTVVVFHGDPRTADKQWHRPDARLLAEQGRVLFLPTWGHVDPAASLDMGVAASWDLMVREMKCAVTFAHSHTAQYGGDPEHITLYGLSAGGNAVLMAGLADNDPLDTCTTPGQGIAVQALVPIDADWVLGGDWDEELSTDPEAFYSITPWRFLDASQDLKVDVVVTEITGPFTRSVEPDPAASWLSYRHPDIDLVADLEERAFLADGDFSLRESGEYAFEVLSEAGYDATLIVLPEASHEYWGVEGMAVAVETVLTAED